jgi:hypothetical protein
VVAEVKSCVIVVEEIDVVGASEVETAIDIEVVAVVAVKEAILEVCCGVDELVGGRILDDDGVVPAGLLLDETPTLLGDVPPETTVLIELTEPMNGLDKDIVPAELLLDEVATLPLVSEATLVTNPENPWSDVDVAAASDETENDEDSVGLDEVNEEDEFPVPEGVAIELEGCGVVD